MSRESEIVEEAMHRGNADALRKDNKRSYQPAYMLDNVNEPVECVMLLGRLNEAVNLMYTLADDHYTDYIWNASRMQTEQLEKEGFTEYYFIELGERLEKLRSIIMGESLDFYELYNHMYASVLGHEVYWKTYYEQQAEKLRNKLQKLEKQQ